MNRDFILDTWVPALRSGEYEQGVGRLRSSTPNGTNYCCLGVAFDCLTHEEPGSFSWTEPPAHFDGTVGHGGMGTMPYEAARYIGLDTTFGDQSALAQLNDAEQESFDEIADRLEVWAERGGSFASVHNITIREDDEQ